MTTLRRLILQYYPVIAVGLLVLILILLVKTKKENHYVNRKYKYSVRFPDEWIREKAKPLEITFKSPDRVPILDEPEASITIVVDTRYDDVDLAGHFNIIIRDLDHAGVRFLDSGRGSVGPEDAVWVQFQDADGLSYHLWYFLFNRTNKLLIIQYRVSSSSVDKYRSTMTSFLESFNLR